MKYLVLLLAADLFAAVSVPAQVKLSPLFTNNMVLQQQCSLPVWGWAAAGKTITVKPSWSGKIYTARVAANGAWRVKMTTPAAGGPYTLTISDGRPLILQNVLVGEVWICTGQSNMEMPMKGFTGQPVAGSNEDILQAANTRIRLFKVERASVTTPQDSCKTTGWQPAAPETVANFSAVGWYFGELLQRLLQVPVGLISCNYGGSSIEAWMDAESLRAFPSVKIPAATDTIRALTQTPTTLYNGMLHPIVGYGIRGSIWYQGESNRNRPALYARLFPVLVSSWRRQWGVGDFPFYYAQIAPYNYQLTNKQPDPYNSALLRDVQRKAQDSIPHTGMAVLLDVGEERLIHPAEKKPVGHRLAYLALHHTYGIQGFGYASPLYDSLRINGNKAVVYFKNAPNGLTSFGQPINHFEIAGADQVFYPASAVVSGATVTVSAAEVPVPVAVRYGFKDFVRGNLYNTEGLPASSFRTDDW